MDRCFIELPYSRALYFLISNAPSGLQKPRLILPSALEPDERHLGARTGWQPHDQALRVLGRGLGCW